MALQELGILKRARAQNSNNNPVRGFKYHSTRKAAGNKEKRQSSLI